jgi:hypothetical protein
MIFFLFLLIVLFGHSKIFKYFLLFHLFVVPKLSFAADLVCSVKFSILSQCLFHFPLYCLSGVSIFGYTAILCFGHLAILL